MQFFIHPINPNYAATHMDVVDDGWYFGIWEHPYPALEPSAYRIQSRTLVAAEDSRKQAEKATKHIASKTIPPDAWLVFPRGINPHSDFAGRFMNRAVHAHIPLRWPWTKVAA